MIALTRDADYVDTKVIEGDVTLSEFLAGALSHYPWWVKALYGVRAVFVRLLGMTQTRPEGTSLTVTPEDISYQAGDRVTVWEVTRAQPDTYWMASITDKHLTATLLVQCEWLASGRNAFIVQTIVHYNNWSGPVYFAFVRPFHHIVVQSMMKAGQRRYA